MGDFHFEMGEIKTFTGKSNPYESFYEREIGITQDTPNIDNLGKSQHPHQETIFRAGEYFVQRGPTCTIFSLLNAANLLGKRIENVNLSRFILSIYENTGSNLIEVLAELPNYHIHLQDLQLSVEIENFPRDPIISLAAEKLLVVKSIESDDVQESTSQISLNEIIKRTSNYITIVDELVLKSISQNSILYFSTSNPELMNHTSISGDKRSNHSMIAVGKRSNIDGTISIQIINSHGSCYWVSLDLLTQQVDKMSPLGIIKLG